MCVCVCVRERERERERVCICIYRYACIHRVYCRHIHTHCVHVFTCIHTLRSFQYLHIYIIYMYIERKREGESEGWRESVYVCVCEGMYVFIEYNAHKYTPTMSVYLNSFIKILSYIVLNWNHFWDEALNLRINFYLFIYLLRTFPPHLGSFLCCFFFHYVSAKFPLVFFRWFTATSDRNAESCNRIPSNYCLP